MLIYFYFFILSFIVFIFCFSVFSGEFLGIFNFFFLFFLFFQISQFLFFQVSFLNFFFIFLIVWLIFFLINCWNKNFLFFYSCFFIIFIFCFLTKKMILFFVFFELSLVPTYYLVIYGKSPERILASKYLILYTFLGSLPLLFKIIYFSFNSSFNFFFFFKFFSGFFYFFILAFLIKLPIFFFHLWLPKAHVEASTEGSMLLAGILLKLGSYGLLLFLSFLKMKIYLILLVMIGGIFSGFFSIFQVDLKSFIAYSSMIHMSFVVVSSFKIMFLGSLGVIYMSVGHGFISAAMFFIVSLVYNFTKSRKIYFLNSVLKVFYFSMFFCGICLILKSSAPLSMKFLGEIYMFLHSSIFLKFWSLILILSMKFLGGFISILFFLLLFHGKKNNLSFNFKFNQMSILFFLSIFSFIFFPILKIFFK